MFKIFLIVFLLSACSTGVPVRADFRKQTVEVTVLYSTEAEVQFFCKWKNGVAPLGCAKFYTDSKHCEIIVPKPEHQNDYFAFQTIGHELFHCTNGSFHD